jgi:hypothetical protein
VSRWCELVCVALLVAGAAIRRSRTRRRPRPTIRPEPSPSSYRPGRHRRTFCAAGGGPAGAARQARGGREPYGGGQTIGAHAARRARRLHAARQHERTHHLASCATRCPRRAGDTPITLMASGPLCWWSIPSSRSRPRSSSPTPGESRQAQLRPTARPSPRHDRAVMAQLDEIAHPTTAARSVGFLSGSVDVVIFDPLHPTAHAGGGGAGQSAGGARHSTRYSLIGDRHAQHQGRLLVGMRRRARRRTRRPARPRFIGPIRRSRRRGRVHVLSRWPPSPGSGPPRDLWGRVIRERKIAIR